MPQPMRRTIPRQLELLSKRGDWRSVALVGVADGDAATWLTQVAPRARLTIVATWPEEGVLRAAKLAGQQRQLRRLARAYGDRLTFLEADPKEALKAVGDDKFDAVALLGGLEGKELGTVGKRWAEHVNQGGMLLGIDHRDKATASALKKLAPEHQKLKDGLWAARIRRPSPEGEEQGEPDPVLSEPPAIEGPELEDPPIEETEPDLEEDPPSDGERDLALEAAEPEPEPAPPVVKRTRGRPRKAP
jgi:hypothetical protein